MTDQQAKLYRWLLDRIDDPVCPSFSEMMEMMGLASKASIARLLDALEQQGRIEREPGRARNIRARRRNPCDGIASAVMIDELKRRGDL